MFCILWLSGAEQGRKEPGKKKDQVESMKSQSKAVAVGVEA